MLPQAKHLLRLSEIQYSTGCYFKPDVLSKEFSLPSNLEPINILAIGYSDEGAADTERFDSTRIPVSQLVSYESL